MPIRPEFRKFYTGPEWKATRERIIERDQHQCKFCGKPEHTWVLVTRDGTGRWNQSAAADIQPPSLLTYRVTELISLLKSSYRGVHRVRVTNDWENGWQAPQTPPLVDAEFIAPAPDKGRVWLIKRALTVAHLKFVPDPNGDRDEDLAALCEYCHLRYDAAFHKLTRSIRKDKARPMFEQIGQNGIPFGGFEHELETR